MKPESAPDPNFILEIGKISDIYDHLRYKAMKVSK